MSVQITALPAGGFTELFALPDEALAARGIRRMVADSCPGCPCRVRLRDVPVGGEVLLLNYQHLVGRTPYSDAHAIFVSRDGITATPAPGEVPDMLTARLVSLRGFDGDLMMRAGQVVAGDCLATTLDALFDDPAISFVDIHFVVHGCFGARGMRA